MPNLFKTRIDNLPPKGTPVTYNNRKVGEITDSEMKDGNVHVTFTADRDIQSLLTSQMLKPSISVSLSPIPAARKSDEDN